MYAAIALLQYLGWNMGIEYWQIFYSKELNWTFGPFLQGLFKQYIIEVLQKEWLQ